MDTDLSFFKKIPLDLKPKRDRVAKLLRDIGLTPIIPEGCYFMLADISKINFDYDSNSSDSKDMQFCKHLIRNVCF